MNHIFSDIHYEDYSDIWLKKKLAKLCESGQVIRYERGIYYIPVKTPFGNSILNPNRIIERKYLSERKSYRILYRYHSIAAGRAFYTDVKYS